MKLIVIGSGSRQGNCYALRASDGTTLLIECGVDFRKTKESLGHDLKNVVGCIVTHEHKDHCKAVNDVLKSGINVWANDKTLQAMNVRDHYNAKRMIMPGTVYQFYRIFGDWRVIVFPVQHDAVDPVGFLIHHPECGTVLFATDTYFLKQKFVGLNNILIEANYCEDRVAYLAKHYPENQYVSDRVARSHMSIQQCLNTLGMNDLTGVHRIGLIHLSDGNSDERSFVKQVERATGKTVFAATAGMEIDFNKSPF